MTLHHTKVVRGFLCDWVSVISWFACGGAVCLRGDRFTSYQSRAPASF